MKTSKCKGQVLTELLVAIGVMAIILPVLLTSFVSSRLGKPQQQQRLQAVHVLTEAIEAVRSIREKDWTTFAVNGTYHPQISGNTWSFATGTGTQNGFTTAVVISDVRRNNGVIVQSGGTIDPSTKKVDIIISWILPYPSSMSTTTYLTRFLENDAYVETTQTQFNAGTKTGVTVQATNGSGVANDGEIILGAGGYSNWCGPDLLTNGLDLPGSGIATGITAIEGKAFAGTGENSSGLSFMSITINNNRPPGSAVGGTFDGYKTNGVFGETNYGYITTDTNSKEVVILNISSGTFTESGYFNAPGNSEGKSIFVLGNTGYVTVGNKLYNFDLSSKSGSRPIRDPDGVTLAGQGTKVIVVGNYAYVSLSGAATELQIIEVTNPTNMVVRGQADVNGQAAYDLFVNSTGTRAYLATGTSSSQPEFFIINTATKTGNRGSIGSYDTAGMDPRGVTVVPGNRAIIVGRNNKEYQVIDISSETSPQKCGEEDVDSGINGIASILEADGDAYSYLVTQSASSEFRIVIGGPGGSYANSGEFESATFNPGYTTANNRLSATFSEPTNTNIRFQVSLAAMVGGSCPTNGYTFVGPDGTTASYFDQASGENITYPFTTVGTYTNPGQCFRYKAYFTTTDSTQTPVLSDVTINYSP